MKKLIIALAAVLITAASYGQGTINFNTRFGAANVDAPVELRVKGGEGAGPAYSAALYLIDAGGARTLIPGSTTTFRDGGSNPLLAKYINPVSPLIVPNMAAGTRNVQVEMRAWIASAGSFDAADPTLRGASGALTIDELGGLNPAANNNLPPMTTFTGFVIPVPEPSTIVLGALGAAALLLRRRK